MLPFLLTITKISTKDYAPIMVFVCMTVLFTHHRSAGVERVTDS